MSARERLIQVFSGGHESQRQTAAAVADDILNEHAHELAEMIRADIIPALDEYGTLEQQAEIDGYRGAANLIDPEEYGIHPGHRYGIPDPPHRSI